VKGNGGRWITGGGGGEEGRERKPKGVEREKNTRDIKGGWRQ